MPLNGQVAMRQKLRLDSPTERRQGLLLWAWSLGFGAWDLWFEVVGGL